MTMEGPSKSTENLRPNEPQIVAMLQDVLKEHLLPPDFEANRDAALDRIEELRGKFPAVYKDLRAKIDESMKDNLLILEEIRRQETIDAIKDYCQKSPKTAGLDIEKLVADLEATYRASRERMAKTNAKLKEDLEKKKIAKKD